MLFFIRDFECPYMWINFPVSSMDVVFGTGPLVSSTSCYAWKIKENMPYTPSDGKILAIGLRAQSF